MSILIARWKTRTIIMIWKKNILATKLVINKRSIIIINRTSKTVSVSSTLKTRKLRMKPSMIKKFLNLMILKNATILRKTNI